MGGQKRRPKKGEGTNRDASRYVPSRVHANHANNFSRADDYAVPAELQPYIEGSTFCFTLAEVEVRLREYLGRVTVDEAAHGKQTGQITAGTIYLTATNDAYLVDGYLRHAAWLLAEVRGLLPEGKTNAFKVDHIRQPKTPADWLALKRRNFAENNSRKILSPIDKATYARRLITPSAGGVALTHSEAANELGLSSKRQLDRYLALLSLPPAQRGAVHAGKLSMSDALKQASQTGQGTAKGPRKGVSLATARKRLELLEVKDVPADMTPKRTLDLVRLLAGTADEETEGIDQDLRDFIAVLDTPPVKPPKEPSKSKKKAPTRQKPK